MSVTEPPVKQGPSLPPEKESATSPFLALLVAVMLAAATGVLVDWPTAATVFGIVVGMFTARRR